ncbi:hypothetical protein VTI74DRAFT_8310 [Chaetomium olivicolor]
MVILYQPLDPSISKIRLLKFTSHSVANPTISLTLYHVSVGTRSRLTYCALSYVWGDPARTERITVNSVPFHATTNLAAALRVLRRSNSTRPSCGPTQSASTSATSPSASSSLGMVASARLAFALIKTLAQGARMVAKHVGGGVSEEEVLAQAQLKDPMLVVVLFSAGVEEMERHGALRTGIQEAMLDVFYNNPYWKRCWTFQELYLAEYGALLCVVETVSIRDAWVVFRWLRLAKTAIVGNAKPDAMSDQAWRFLRNIVNILNGLPLSFSMLVKESLASEGREVAGAAKPRACFYSLLGLSEISPIIDGRTLKFRGVIIGTIARAEAGWHAIPTSYVLDKSFRPNMNMVRAILDELAKFFFNCPFDAFLSELVASPELYADSGTRFLALLRYLFHDQRLTGETFGRTTIRNLDCEDVARLAKQPRMIFGLRPRGMARILNMDRPLRSWTGETFLTRREERNIPGGCPACSPDDDDPAVMDFLPRHIQEFQAVTKIRTETGFIGHARNVIEPWDVACVLDGCSIPAVLRPRPGADGYNLASCAFVVGMMNGEAGKLVEEEGRGVCDITLRTPVEEPHSSG